MATDWETRYYEQQALHTEARGMLCQERDRWIQRAQKAERELDELRAKPLARGDGPCGVCGEPVLAHAAWRWMRGDTPMDERVWHGRCLARLPVRPPMTEQKREGLDGNG